MKWLTLNSSAMRESGESRSVWLVCVQELKMISVAAAQGTIDPVSSLHIRVTDG